MPYYRTIYEIEVLSDDARSADMSLSDIEYEITEGHCSGTVSCTVHEVVSAEQMAELLLAHGSDPSFLLSDEDMDEMVDNHSKT